MLIRGNVRNQQSGFSRELSSRFAENAAMRHIPVHVMVLDH
jgi:hypothetical protein